MNNNPLIKKLVALAVEEDLSFGDITSELTVLASHTSSAKIIARESLLLCGTDMVLAVVAEIDPSVEVKIIKKDGTVLADNDVIAVLTGPTRSLLAIERTALNFLQKLSGIASHVNAVIKEANGLILLDTRKTTPGWRVLEKYAVKIGGAKNHRAHLGEMILVKNNHLDIQTSIPEFIAKLISEKPPYMPLEIEVRAIAELVSILPAFPNIIMLDNMNDDLVAEAVKVIQAHDRHISIEVSGGITPERVKSLSKLGAGYVSMGALTTKATWRDISMRITSK